MLWKRRDYYLADSIVGKVDAIRSLENVTILFLDKRKKLRHNDRP